MKPTIRTTAAVLLATLLPLAGQTPRVGVTAAGTYFNNLPAQTRVVLPANPAGEIAALAAGLENDPALIVAYVRNHFRHVPYYGHMKGPHETLMDQAGNDYDLCRLTVEMLRAAGYPSAGYVRGTITYPLATAANWLGVSESQVSTLLAEAGIPHNAPDSSIAIERIWVQMNGVNVDPAFKQMTKINGIDVGPLMGYNQSQLLSGAGGTTSTSAIRNVNASNVEARLTSWTTTLVNSLKAGYSKASVAEIIGGFEIVPLAVPKGNLTPLEISASGTGFTSPDAKRMHTVKVTIGTDERIVNMPDIDGNIFAITSIPGSAQPANQLMARSEFFSNASFLLTASNDSGGYRLPPVIQGGKSWYFSFRINKIRSNPNTGGSDRIQILNDDAGAFRLNVTEDGIAPVANPPRSTSAFFETSAAMTGYNKDVHVYVNKEVAPGSYLATLKITDYSLNRNPNDTIIYQIPLIANVLPNHVMQLKVGDTVIWSDSAVTAANRLANYDFKVAVDHPYPATNGTHADQVVEDDTNRKVFRGSKYVFCSLGGDSRWTGRRVSDRLERCQTLMNSLAGPESEEVVLNTLSAFGSQYLAEGELKDELAAQFSNSVLIYHHQLAIAKREAGYVMDHLLRRDVNIGRSGAVDSDQLGALGSMFGSALEHGSYEQFQDTQAVSTIKALYLANADGQKIYKVDKNSFAAIRGELTSYATVDLDWYQQRMTDKNLTYVMHGNGSTVLNEWSDHGYIEIYPYGGRAMMIGGGFNYWNNVFGGVSSTRAWESQSTRMQRMMREGRRRLLDARMAAMSAEPVDLKTGAYVYNMTELTVGTVAPPRGLDFQRSYNSDAAQISGPLGRGWDHNWNSRLESTSDPRIGLGMRQPADAAAWLVAIHTMRNLIATPVANDAKGLVVQAIVAKWAADQLKDNATSAKLAGESAVFARQPDGTYPPPGSKFTLEKNGSTGHFLKNRFGTSFTFDVDGKLAGISDIYNKTLSVGWAGDLVSFVKDAYNRRLDFVYGGDSLLDTVTDSTGRSISFSYEGGNLATFTDPDSFVFRYAYDGGNRLQEFRNGENEVVAFNHYDTRGKVDYQDSEGLPARRWKFFIAPFRTVQQDPQGGRTIYEYNRLGNQTAQTDAIGNRQTFLYNAQNQLTGAVDAKQQVTEFDYDNRLNLTKTRKFKGGIAVETGATYDALNRQDSVSNANGLSVTYHYNALHEKEWEQDPDGNRTTYTYCPAAHAAAGQIATITVPGENGATHTTTYVYDSLGHLDRIDYPDGTSENYTYDARGNLSSLTDRRLKLWQYFYTGRRLLHREVDPSTDEKIFTYNSYGKILTSTDRNGNQTVNTYHPAGWLKDSTNAEQETTLFAYDSRDWQTKVISPLGNDVETTYLANGWPEKVFDPVALPTRPTAEYFYQPNGNREKVRNALLQDTTYTFDDLNRVEKVTDTRSVQIAHTLDQAGNTRFLKNGRLNDSESIFDKLNRETDFYTPLRRHTHRVYSPRGLLQSVQEPSGQTAALTYDAVGRVVTRTDGVGVTSYHHDGNGNLETVTEGGKTITREYDDQNRVSLYRNGDGEELEYRYHPEGNLWKIIYPDKTKVVEYTYDDANRLKTVKDWNNKTTTYHWDDDGWLERIDRPNGTSREIQYDGAGRSTAIREIGASGKLIAYYKFNRDALGRVKDEIRAPRPPPYRTPLQASTFDADDRLATYNGQNVTHDADANMTSAPVAGDEWRVFNYDARNRLTSVDDPGVWQNVFDAEGTRTEILKEGASTKFVVSPGTLPKTLVQINPDGTRRYFIHGLGLLYHIDGEDVAAPVTTTYHYNAQGSTVALSDDSGTAVGRFHYDPYGAVLAKQGKTDTIFQFNGHYGIATDSTGLVHLNARFYNPHLKRFMNSDPSGFGGGMNWFAYSNGDPVNLFDPLGLGAADSERYTWVDGVQDGIGVAGMIPGLGVVPDGVNAAIYLFRGRYEDAGMSTLSLIPIIGDIAAGAKYIDKVNDVRKIAREAEEGAEEMIDVYRGVHADHPDLPNARNGEANPIGGHRNPEWHNTGDNASDFTSWTTDRYTADYYASRYGDGGVVLKDRVSKVSLIASPDAAFEQEVLRLGRITGAIPIKPRKP